MIDLKVISVTPTEQKGEKEMIDMHEVVKRLIGPIDPVGAEHVDRDRLENLKKMTELVDRLLGDIDKIIPNKDRAEASMKRAGEHANDFFDSLGITE